MRQFKKKVKALREKRGRSQENLTREINISFSTVKRWVKKVVKPPVLLVERLGNFSNQPELIAATRGIMAKLPQSKILTAMPACNEGKYIGSIVTKVRQYAANYHCLIIRTSPTNRDVQHFHRHNAVCIGKEEELRGVA